MPRLIAYLIFPPTFGWNLLLGRLLRLRNWWDRIDDHVYLGALPLSADVPKLAQLGISGVVNMCDEHRGPEQSYREFQIRQLRIPTIDFNHPTLEAVEQGVAFIDDQVRNQKSVYVHCKAGRARSATVVACWLIKHYQISACEAQERLLAARPHVNPRLANRPVVQHFEAKHRVAGIL
jgi:atypical dual specificity phosphatase